MDRRAGTVGFALTILQRRLASSPDAIYQSLRRRKERLENRLEELRQPQRGSSVSAVLSRGFALLDPDDIEDLEDAPPEELLVIEDEVLDQATTARTVEELETEIKTLRRLESLAQTVRQSGEDRKWRELADLLQRLFTSGDDGIPPLVNGTHEGGTPAVSSPIPSPHQKLVVFTEHRDTLNYLHRKITTLLGREDSVVMIHGGVGATGPATDPGVLS